MQRENHCAKEVHKMVARTGRRRLPVDRVELSIDLEQSVTTQPPSRVFYGWWVVAACVVMLTLSSGIGFYGLGVFMPSLEEEFGASPTSVSLGATVFFLVFGLAGPYVGRRVDVLGARLVMIVGSAIFGVGLVGLGLSHELWHTYASYVVIAAGFAGMALVPVGALVSAWFNGRRGLAMAVAMSGISLGGVVIAPLATELILAYGWRVAAVALAILVWVVGIPLSALVVRRRPEDLGLLPDGAAKPPAQLAGGGAGTASAGGTWTLSAAWRTRAFWGVAIGYLLINLSLIGVLMHQIRFLTHGTAAQGAISPQAAALAVSLTAFASIAGRLALGTVIDRLSTRWVAVGLMVVQAASTVGLLVARDNLGMIYLTVLAFGTGMGCVIMLQSLLVSDLFGVASFGQIYGAMTLVATLGMAAGPWTAGFLFERFGGYEVAFSLFAAIAVLAAASVAFARRPTLPEERGVPGEGI
jgi:MFS family permease